MWILYFPQKIYSAITTCLSVLCVGDLQVIFLTTLFYLLAASGDQYLPVAWFVNLSPGQGGPQGNKFGRAVEEAIR